MFLVSARALVLSLSLITRVSSKVHKGGRKRSKRGGGPMAACSAAYLAGAGLVAPGCDDASSCCSADGLNLFASSLELLPLVKDAGGAITAAGFTRMCELTLPLIESFGPAFSMVRNDIRNNVERIRKRQATDPARFELLFPIVLDEVARRDDNHSQSCTKAVLWLKRGMEFMLAILARLLELPPGASMTEVTREQYNATIHKWHGFLASSAFGVAINFVPSRDTFLERLAGGRFTDATALDMAKYVAQFRALLGEVHAFLDAHGLDDPTKV